MKLTEAKAQELYHQMHLYLQQLSELQDILARERQSMAQRDFDRFEQILLHKNNLLNEVALFDQSVTKLLKKILPNPTKENVEALFEQHKGAQAVALRLQWQAIREKSERCKRANEINGKVIAHLQHHYSRLVSLLRQEDQNATTYAKNGRQTNGGSSGGRLAQA